MYAILNIQGKQYKVTENQKLLIDRVSDEAASKVVFKDVLYFENDKESLVGTPTVSGVSVEAEIVEHIKDKKVIIFKKKKRHNYRRKNGHRQARTLLKILAIKK
ncbi:MAG: 50S ribosomal protein L21 [Rickettsiales bacterium]|jgi:large subunit ribosomal protein L21|nr:50S ribosomal protein L21 [Rickettsiales bacterium]